LLEQLAGLQWNILYPDKIQTPQQTFRESFTEVVMLPVLREQLKIINPWLEDDQVEEVINSSPQPSPVPTCWKITAMSTIC